MEEKRRRKKLVYIERERGEELKKRWSIQVADHKVA